MCTDRKCPFENKCYRYMATPREFEQAYFSESPRKGDECEEFIKFHQKRYYDK